MRSAHTALWAMPVLALIASGCTQRYTRWHKKVKNDKGVVLRAKELCSGTDMVEVTAFTLKSEPVSDKTLWDLSPEGQAAYIDRLAELTKGLKELDAALSSPVGKEAIRKTDLSTFKKRIVLSVENKCTQVPANRIGNLEIALELAPGSPVRFVSWNKLETRYATVDLGKLSHTSGGTFEFAPGVELLGGVVGAQAGKIGWSNSITEELNLSRRFVDVTGILEPTKGRLVLEGMPGRDLAGNIVVEVTLAAISSQVTVTHVIGPLFTPAGDPVAPANVKVEKMKLVVPQYKQDVPIKMTYKGDMRSVLNRRGARTIAEGDDVVRYTAFTNGTGTNMTLATADDMQVPVWTIGWDAPPGTTHTIELKSKTDPADVAMLAFRSPGEAGEFLAWLQRAKAKEVSGYDLVQGLGGQPIPTADAEFDAMYVDPFWR